MSCFSIPIELELNILERLPVKTLVTITAVCKSWYSLIKTPRMLKRYRESSIVGPEREGHAVLISRNIPNHSENEYVVISQDSFVVRETFSWDCRYGDLSKLNYIGSCCNGVICMSEDTRDGKEVYLFNPSIRKIKPLPYSFTDARVEECDTKVDRFFGFGYDEINDDYKVVLLYRICERSWDNEPEIYKIVEAEVYSLRNDTWKTVEFNDHRYYPLGRSVSVNNAIHWICNKNDGHFRKLILAFDFNGEVFREIVLPVDGMPVTFVVSYKGELAILVIEESKEDDESKEVSVSLWIMKEYGVKDSWNKEFTKVIHGSFSSAVNFTNNGKLIFRKKRSRLAIWDPETKEELVLFGFRDKRYAIVEDYTESLILI